MTDRQALLKAVDYVSHQPDQVHLLWDALEDHLGAGAYSAVRRLRAELHLEAAIKETREQAFSEGWDAAMGECDEDAAFDDGQKEGFIEGMEAGYAKGYKEGKIAGRQEAASDAGDAES